MATPVYSIFAKTVVKGSSISLTSFFSSSDKLFRQYSVKLYIAYASSHAKLHAEPNKSEVSSAFSTIIWFKKSSACDSIRWLLLGSFT